MLCCKWLAKCVVIVHVSRVCILCFRVFKEGSEMHNVWFASLYSAQEYILL